MKGLQSISAFIVLFQLISSVLCEPCRFGDYPFCGTDGRTYGNYCEFEATQSTTPKLDIIYAGSCGKPHRDTFCACPNSYEPICGNDNVTYGNYCKFSCVRKAYPKLKINRHEECGRPSIS